MPSTLSDIHQNHPIDIQSKYESLLTHLRSLTGVVVAFSGGVDSSFLLSAVHDSGISHVAVTAKHPAVTDCELETAKKVAAHLGVRHKIIELPVMENADFVSNTPERCFHCKSTLIKSLLEIAAQVGFSHVLDGTNSDDVSDFRPGLRANAMAGVLSPLVDAGLTKDEIRRLSFEKCLPTWNSPSAPCLATRLPYGEPLTRKSLEMIGLAEAALKDMGFPTLRVRKEKDTARIELPSGDIERAAGFREQIVATLLDMGFLYVSLDLEGFKSGKMNRAVLEKPHPHGGQ